MAYWLDYRHIDDEHRPGTGPIYNFMKFNRLSKAEITGVCVDIAETNRSYVARRRVYELHDASRNVLEAIITHTDVEDDEFKSDYVSHVLFLTCVAYCLTALNLAPDQILFPAGMYGSECERRAVQGLLRPKYPHEMARGLQFSCRLSGHVSRLPNVQHGMYCLDESKMDELFAGMELLIGHQQICNRFGIIGDIPACITPKVRVLLENSFFEGERRPKAHPLQ